MKAATAGALSLRGGAGVLTAFLLAKATMFLAPLLLAHAVGVTEYGVFEFALALASPVALLASCGMAGAIPYFLIKRGWSAYTVPIKAHLLLVGAALAAGSLLFAFGVVALRWYLFILLVAMTVMQSLSSITLKVHGRLTLSSLLESGLYIVLFAVLVGHFALGTPADLAVISAGFFVYAAAFLLVTLQRYPWKTNWRRVRRRYVNMLRFGAPLIVASALFTLVASAGRILAGQFLSMEDVGIYSFFFRLAGGVILVHQLLTTMRFREFYASSGVGLDRYFSRFLGLGFLAAAAGFLVLPLAVAPFSTVFDRLIAEHRVVFFILSFQMVFWVGMALAEMVTVREGKSGVVIGLLTAALASLVAAVFGLQKAGWLTLQSLAVAHLLVTFFCMAGQWVVLARSGIRLPRVAVASLTLLTLFFAFLGMFPG